MNKQRHIIAIYEDTGEIVKNANIIIKKEQERCRRQKIKRLAEKNKRRNRALNPFVFYLYQDNIQDQFKGLKSGNVARLMHLSTYVSYHENILMASERRAMRKRDLRKILQLNKDSIYQFIYETTENGFLTLDKENIRIDDLLFYKGNISDADTKYFIRIHIKPMRELYFATPPRLHSQLGYLFKLIPFVNIKWNIICYNPHEIKLEKIEPLSARDICGIVGYNRSQASRLMKSLQDLHFLYQDNDVHLCSVTSNNNWKNQGLICNPNILYAGNDKLEVELLGAF